MSGGESMAGAQAGEPGKPISYTLCAARAQDGIESPPFNVWAFPDGTPWVSFHRSGNGFLLRFPELADFSVSSDGLEVMAYPVPEVSAQTVEHLYLNQVQPLALSRQLKLVLHASAAEVGDFAVAFLGVSGRGKSTLAASFSTGGYRFLTDDGLQLEKTKDGHLIRPGHPSIRLWDDSREALIPETADAAPALEFTPKARLLAGEEVAFCEAPRPLRCVYFLGEGEAEAVSIEPVGARDAMLELVKHSFLLDVEAQDMLAHHFGQLVDLAKTLRFFSLDYPRRYEMLSQVRDAVVRHAASSGK